MKKTSELYRKDHKHLSPLELYRATEEILESPDVVASIFSFSLANLKPEKGSKQEKIPFQRRLSIALKQANVLSKSKSPYAQWAGNCLYAYLYRAGGNYEDATQSFAKAEKVEFKGAIVNNADSSVNAKFVHMAYTHMEWLKDSLLSEAPYALVVGNLA
jgi:hypothetical protein